MKLPYHLWVWMPITKYSFHSNIAEIVLLIQSIRQVFHLELVCTMHQCNLMLSLRAANQLGLQIWHEPKLEELNTDKINGKYPTLH
jgi:hypothetical protein